MSESSKKKLQIFRKHQIMGRCVSDWQGQIIVNSMQSLPIHYRQQGEWGVNLNLSVDMLDILFKYKVRKKALHWDSIQIQICDIYVHILRPNMTFCWAFNKKIHNFVQ